MRRITRRRLLALVLAVLVVFAGWPDCTPLAIGEDEDPPPVPRIRMPEAGDIIVKLPPDELLPAAVGLTIEDAEVPDWGHAAIGVLTAWRVTKGKGVVVGVLDTGCECDHPDLAGAVKKAKDFTSSRSGCIDVQGHGTHTAGTIGARENGQGSVGVAPECTLLVAKVLNDQGWGTDRDIAAGIDWLVAEGADIISASLGSPGRSAPIADAVARAQKVGVLFVAAAGNAGPKDGTVGFPGALPGVVCVGAVDQKLQPATFSSRGPSLSIAAPGVGVRAPYPGGRQANLSGTSMATPYVSGCAALALAAARARGEKVSGADLAARLTATAQDIPPMGRDTATGFGLVRPGALVGPTPGPIPAPMPGDVWRIELPDPLKGKKIKSVVIEFETP